MRTRMKLLTVGLVLATAAMAGCSSTTGSSGAVQNAATAPASSSASAAASSATSTTPAPSPDPVTPTAEPTEAPSSPVASPTDSPSASESPQGSALGGKTLPPNKDVCIAGLAYSCGDIGASGVGTVFYANSTAFACGANMASTCNYLEVAPNGWNGTLFDCFNSCGGSPNKTSDWGGNKHDKTKNYGDGYMYCSGSGKNNVIPNASGTVVGSGFVNTSGMLTMCNSDDAGELARGYTGGGMTDWSLPSEDEINALYYYPNRNAIGGFAAYMYWSSSQSDKNNATYWIFKEGKWPTEGDKNMKWGVRPIRAF